MDQYAVALSLVKHKITELRKQVPQKRFNKNKPAEVEVNRFYFEGQIVDRIMVVLRANGCEHYKKSGGCSMCSHYNGTMANEIISTKNYKKQWDSVLDGSCLEKPIGNFDLNNFPIVCIYNLGSLLNQNEITIDAVRYIFSTLNKYKQVQKAIIESRAEYVNRESFVAIQECYDGLLEVGIGVESTDNVIRELCHSKGYERIDVIKKAVNTLHEFNYKALAYINFKPCFLTEQEAIDDAIKTCVDCFSMGFDAVSIEPTSLQEHALTSFLSAIGYYRVPWLWSLPKVVHGIYDRMNRQRLDIRLGGYFDELVLSGSQGEGFAGRNEIFPHETSYNCKECTRGFVKQIKKFNVSYDVADLDSVERCDVCYNLWQDCYNVKDTRSIPQRIIDVLSA